MILAPSPTGKLGFRRLDSTVLESHSKDVKVDFLVFQKNESTILRLGILRLGIGHTGQSRKGEARFRHRGRRRWSHYARRASQGPWNQLEALSFPSKTRVEPVSGKVEQALQGTRFFNAVSDH